jgi:hypothetical protein
MSAYTKRRTRRSPKDKQTWPTARRAMMALRAKQRREARRPAR